VNFNYLNYIKPKEGLYVKFMAFPLA
jgi:hypothetical protein